jgi:hypothetical protein
MEVPSKLSKIWSDGSPAIAVEAKHRSMHCPHRTERCGENCASGGRLASVAVMESTHRGQESAAQIPNRKCYRDRGADSGVDWRREMPRSVVVPSKPPKANR